MYYGAVSSFFALINPSGIGLFVAMLPVFVALYLKDFLTGFHLIAPTHPPSPTLLAMPTLLFGGNGGGVSLYLPWD